MNMNRKLERACEDYWAAPTRKETAIADLRIKLYGGKHFWWKPTIRNYIVRALRWLASTLEGNDICDGH